MKLCHYWKKKNKIIMITKMEKLREVNEKLSVLLIDLETRIFVEESNGRKKIKGDKVKSTKSSIYK